MVRNAPTAILLLWKDAPDPSHKVRTLIEREFEVVLMRYCAFKDKTVDQDMLARLQADYLFSFNPVILKRHVLESVKIAAINFHTAPPKYPGRGGCSYALYNEDDCYGVTAHLMTEQIDAGAILDTLYFPIESTDTAQTLHEKALNYIPLLVKRWLQTKLLVPNGEQWCGAARTQKDFIEFMRVESPDELERKIRACQHPAKPGPYVEICGKKFWYIGA